ncbi:hypothetical protein ACQEU8_02285 [Streptomyces sp. CA-250714]|uniref:hypothetical protein n=1 Tax=Streptomyces sp. CA-250714 TaxID=3240060 RepID=UPI003D8A4F37
MPNFRSRSMLPSGAPGSVLLGAAVLLLGVGAATACTASDSRLYGGPGEASSTASPTFSAKENASPPGLSASARNALTALDTAEQAVPRSTAYHLVRDGEGEPEWEIKVAAEGGSEWSVTVSDDGHKVTERHEDTSPDDNADKLAGFRVPIGKAVRQTAERHPGQELRSAAVREDREGRDRWEVTVAEGTTVEASESRTLIDVRTGREHG